MKEEKKRVKPKIGIIGGGIAGGSIALYLGELGLDVTLFEKGKSLVNGPPMCHLHAGGNLYREISDKQCKTLLEESIDLVRFFPQGVDYRPTVIATPKDDPHSPLELLPRLKMLKKAYESMIKKDPENKVLGEVDSYYKLYSSKDLVRLKKQDLPKSAKCMDDWMIGVAKKSDLDKLQFPLIMVAEFGLNMFRIASILSLALSKMDNVKVNLNHNITNIYKNSKNRWSLNYHHNAYSKEESFDYIINAAGFRTGLFDDMISVKAKRFVEFKAAYVTKWKEPDVIWPEVIFHGQRGTPKGMAQFTPYPDGFFQLHGMTKDITLFEDGLVQSTEKSAQPKLKQKFLDKIDKDWDFSEVKERSQKAIDHLANYIPAFKSAQVVSKPLFGAQQIPGDDESLRAANVSFDGENYARCEIVKASSVLSMADEITKKLIDLKYIDSNCYKQRDFKTIQTLLEEDINKYAKTLCKERGYPESLAKRSMEKLSYDISITLVS